jgi:hypothetical protein
MEDICSYSIVHDPHTKGCMFEMHSSNKGTQVHPAVLSWLGKNWKKVVSSNNSCLTLPCFTEYTHKNSTKFCSHLNYHDKGPWYNCASVCLEKTEQQKMSHAGCCCFIANRPWTMT